MRRNLRQFPAWLVLSLLAASMALSQAPGGRSGGDRAPRRRALIIGVRQYTGIPALRYTSSDAAAFRKVLIEKWGWDPRSIAFLSDDALDANGDIDLNKQTEPRSLPTRGIIKSRIDLLLNDVDQDTEVVVYFSGHGMRVNDQDYLAPWDIPKLRTLQDVADNGVSATDLRNRLETAQPRRALVFIDACRTVEAQARGIFEENDFGQGFRSQAAAAPQSQVAFLFACRPKEESIEDPDLKHGVFTHFLTKAMQEPTGMMGPDQKPILDENGNLTFSRLQSYVTEEVATYAYSKGREQHPFGSVIGGGDVLLASYQAPIPPEKDRLERLVRQAYDALDRPDLEAAGAQADAALKIDGKNPDALYIRGRVRLERAGADKTRIQVALGDLNEALSARADFSKAILDRDRAAAMLDTAEVNELLQAAEGALKAAPPDRKLAEEKAQLVLARTRPSQAQARSQAHYLLGRAYEAGNDPDAEERAIAEYAQATGVKEAEEAQVRLVDRRSIADLQRNVDQAERLFKDRQYDLAESRATTALEALRRLESLKKPYDPLLFRRTNLVLGEVGMAESRWQDAQDAFRRAQQPDRAVEASLALKASVDAEQAEAVLATEPAKAESLAKGVLELKTINQRAQGRAGYVLGQVYERGQKTEEAIRAYQVALGRDPGLQDARRRLDQLTLVDLPSREVDGVRQLLQQTKLDNRFEDAEAERKTAASLTAAVSRLAGIPPGAQKALYHQLMGRIAAANWKYDEAAREFEQARTLDPTLTLLDRDIQLLQIWKDASGGAAAAGEDLRRGEFLRAAAKADAVLRSNPTRAVAAQVYAVRGYARLQLDDEKRGQEDIRKAMELDGNLALAHRGAGTIIYRQGHGYWQQANAARNGPNPDKARELEAQARPFLTQARDAFQRACQCDPNDIFAYNDLGVAYSELGDAAKARESYERVIKVAKPSTNGQGRLGSVELALPAALTNLGNLSLRDRDYKRAEELYRQAIRLADKQPAIYAQLAGVLAQESLELKDAGKKKEADAAWKEALDMGQEAKKLGLRKHWVFSKRWLNIE